MIFTGWGTPEKCGLLSESWATLPLACLWRIHGEKWLVGVLGTLVKGQGCRDWEVINISVFINPCTFSNIKSYILLQCYLKFLSVLST